VRPAGEEVAPKIGSLGPGDLEVQGTQSSFARDSLYHALAEKTHTEIFKTDKDAVKKQINYSNYSLHPSHLISNKPLGDDRVMGLYVNDKIMDYKTPYVEDLQSSIRDHNVQINEKFHFKNSRMSLQAGRGRNGSLAMSNLKNGSSHLPVAPSNPHKPLFQG
jgi:hypothetical protein